MTKRDTHTAVKSSAEDGVRPRGVVYKILAVVAASLALLLSQLYVFVNPAYDISTFIVGVAFPLLFGSIIFIVTQQRILPFAFLAYFWSIVDDSPVSFDAVFTWPEVTRFHPAAPHLFMEVLLHLLTLVFLYLTIRQALRGTKLTAAKAVKVSLLTLVAFVLSYAQNIPIASIQAFVENGWYQIDVLEHGASLIFLYLAIREARKSETGTHSIERASRLG
jgi:hypothetical protein